MPSWGQLHYMGSNMCGESNMSTRSVLDVCHACICYSGQLGVQAGVGWVGERHCY